MPLSRIGPTLLYFAHVPKTGGSSIEAYLAAKGAMALRHFAPKRWSRTTPQHMPERVFRDFVPDDFYDYGFVILRDPKARIISTFRMRVGGRHAWYNPLNWALAAWGRLRGRKVFAIDFWRLRLSMDFDTWVRLVHLWRLWRPYVYDGHCIPQAKYVHPGHTVFLFEDGLDPVMRWIDRVTGTPPAEGRFHEKKAPRIEVECSPATEGFLRRIYAADYELIERHRASADRLQAAE